MRKGRFGPYVQRGEGKEAKRSSLPKGWSVTTVKVPDGRTVTCVVVNLNSSYGYNAPAMSCDWGAR